MDYKKWLEDNVKELEELNTLLRKDSWVMADEVLKKNIHEDDYKNLLYPLKFIAKDYLRSKIAFMGKTKDDEYHKLEVSIFNELTQCNDLARLFKIYYLISIIVRK